MADDIVWMIEAYEPFARCAQMILAAEGYDVRLFSEPYKAAQVLRDGEQPPDAVICDLFLNRKVMLDGVQFYSTMASQLAKTAKFIYEGNGLNNGDKVLGGVTVLQKAASVDKLAELVRKGIDEIRGKSSDSKSAE